MRVFISWSGPAAQLVANALSAFIGECIQAAKPWTSELIPNGAMWGKEILDQLAESKVGIVCVTKANQRAEWLLFEAGAIVRNASVNVFLIDAERPGEIEPPLGLFQATMPTQADVSKLLKTINSHLPEGSRRTDEQLTKSCATQWPDLESAVTEARKLTPPTARRSQQEMLEELVATSRETSAGMSAIYDAIRAANPYVIGGGGFGTGAFGSSPYGSGSLGVLLRRNNPYSDWVVQPEDPNEPKDE